MNIVVLVADTFRVDYLGCDGNRWIRTPHLDALATQGVLFKDFYAEGLPTLPVRRVFYTGRTVFPFAYHEQKSDTVQLPGWHPLFEEDVTLAEWLAPRGYPCGLISDVYHQFGKNFHRGSLRQWISREATRLAHAARRPGHLALRAPDRADPAADDLQCRTTAPARGGGPLPPR